MTRRALVVCPGRGAYERASLGQLQDRGPAARAVIERCDAWRRAHDQPTVTELDGAETFRGTLHVAGEHASLLTFACSTADLAELAPRYEVVGVVGNSMGFYTALAAAGALSLDDAVRLVDTLGAYQKDNVIGGQVLYPVATDGGGRDPSLLAAVDAALASAPDGLAWTSIRLGGFAVLGASRDGVRHLLGALPPITRGDRTFPLQLPLHSAFHTPLMRETSHRARADLADLGFRAPRVPLIDGRGVIFRPGWSSPTELADYTLGTQIVDVFDFDLAIRTALAHCAPDVVVALGPGNALGGPLSRLLVEAGWNGHRTREDFDARQLRDPLLLSFGVRPQRQRLL